MKFFRNGAEAIPEIAAKTLAGELRAERGEHNTANRAIMLVDNLIHIETSDRDVCVRQALGVVLADAGRIAEAEAMHRQELVEDRENG